MQFQANKLYSPHFKSPALLINNGHNIRKFEG
jgi:hypothetical protein